MSQSAVTSAPRPSNRASGSKDIDPASSVAARLRSHKQTNESGPTATKETVQSNDRELQRLQTPADESQAVDPSPACMTRQRTATAAPSDDSSTQKDGESPPQSATSAEAVSQICLCQPDPKIPRPRNAFILYRQNNQQNIISQNRGLSNPEISKIAGQLWQNEPEEVKKVWKDLAENEKQRHAQQYPDYRFQPRHKSKTSPTTGPGDKVRCQKCGGQSIAANSSPFATPTVESKVSRVKIATPPHTSREIDSNSHRKVAMLNTSGQPHHNECYTSVGSPLTRKFPESAIELSDPKRRRFDNYNSSVSASRPEMVKSIITSGQTANTVHALYPSPRFADPRRSSQSGHPDTPYYGRPSIAQVPDSPSTMTPHPGPPAMGPPLSRVSSISGRNPLHAYPATPISAQHHGLPYTAATSRPRTDSESLRLAPLLSPGAGDHSRSIAAMIMTIPVIGKLGQLRRIAPPIKAPAPETPAHRVRGSIIAVEGDDRSASEAMLGQLETYLRRNDEFDVRVLAGPRDPKPGCTIKDFLDMVSEWHDETKRMTDFVTGVEYQRSEEAKTIKEGGERSISSPNAAGSAEPMDTDLEEGEVVESTPEKNVQTSEQEQELEKKKEEMAAAVEREARRQSAAAEHSSKIPLLLVSRYILSASNAWSSSLPIEDVYSPADHWAWTATLWRGITGADLTVYVRNVEREGDEPMSAGATAGPSPMERKVEMKDDVGAILVKREGGKVEDGAVRRVAFEVGEWVRMQAGKHN